MFKFWGNMSINDKEFAVIKEISSNQSPDQRSIAIKTGISLGLTNLIIKRLTIKGYIKAKLLNRKKIQYLLTPEGFSEQATRSYAFAKRTVGLLKKIREQIQELVIKHYKLGCRSFSIIGSDELADIAEIAIKNLKTKDIAIDRKQTSTDTEVVILVTDMGENIDLLKYLSDTQLLLKD